MQNLEQAVGDVIVELARSMEKHGAWQGYSKWRAVRVIAGELLEVVTALMRGDIHGEHGFLVELKQVASAALKAYLVFGGDGVLTVDRRSHET